MSLNKLFAVQKENYTFENKFASKGENGPFVLALDSYELRIMSSYSEIRQIVSEGYDISCCPFINKLEVALNGSSVIFMLFLGKILAHASWVFKDEGANSFDGLFRKMRYEKSGCIGPCFTSHEHRGKGIYSYVLIRICDYLKKAGFHRALINTKATNIASLKGIVKAGFKVFQKYTYVKVFLCERYFIKPIDEAIVINGISINSGTKEK